MIANTRLRVWDKKQGEMIYLGEMSLYDTPGTHICFGWEDWQCHDSTNNKKLEDFEIMLSTGIVATKGGRVNIISCPSPENEKELIVSKGGFIFLSDIVQISVNVSKKDILYIGVGVVEFHAGCFMIRWLDDPEANMDLVGMDKRYRPWEYIEVMGNIYENPELVEKYKK